jgi:hypothetical protein
MARITLRRLIAAAQRGLKPRQGTAITWEWLIAAARRGEPELLLDFIDRCDWRFSPAHHQDLHKLLGDALAGNLDRPSHRVKLSPQTRAHVFHKRHLHAQAF